MAMRSDPLGDEPKAPLGGSSDFGGRVGFTELHGCCTIGCIKGGLDLSAPISNGPEGGAGAEDAASIPDAGIDVSLIRAELVRSLRHDLRTHVSHVVGFSEILQHKAAEAGHTALLVDLRKVETAGWGLLGFLTETLDLAKIEAGKLQPELITSQLRGLLDSILGQTDQLVCRQEIAVARAWRSETMSR